MQHRLRLYWVPTTPIEFICGTAQILRIMDSWIIDYHHALLLRLIGLALLVCALSVFRLLAGCLRQVGRGLFRHSLQGTPICRQQKL